MGYVPEYVNLFIAAKECNCKPWELLEQSTFWIDKALIVHSGIEQGVAARQPQRK